MVTAAWAGNFSFVWTTVVLVRFTGSLPIPRSGEMGNHGPTILIVLVPRFSTNFHSWHPKRISRKRHRTGHFTSTRRRASYSLHISSPRQNWLNFAKNAGQ